MQPLDPFSSRPSTSRQLYRRLAGLFIGGLLGLAYGLVGQYVNHFYLPGLPLYQPPFGAAGNLLLAVGLGIFLGLLCAWSEASVPGTLLAAAVGALLMLWAAFIFDGVQLLFPVSSVVIVFAMLLPISGILVPLTALVRVAVNRQTDYRTRPMYLPVRWWLPLVLVLLAVGAGYLNRYSQPAQVVLRRMDAMLTAAGPAASPADLPEPLQAADVGNYLANAGQAYQLAWDDRDLQRYGIPRPLLPEWEMAVVIARYDNGWNLVCLYPNPQLEPRCRGFTQLP